MFNKKFALFYGLFLVAKHVCGGITTKQDILDINVDDYKIKDDSSICPEFSMGNSNSNDWCQFEFYCKDDVCAKANTNSVIQLPSNTTIIDEYIVTVCRSDDYASKKCTQDIKCNSDEDCLSNKCLDTICLANENSPVIKCMNVYFYDYFRFKGREKMHCGKTDGESCEKNDECASNQCDSNFCITTTKNHSNDKLTPYMLLIFAVVVIILIFLIICLMKRYTSIPKRRNTEIIYA